LHKLEAYFIHPLEEQTVVIILQVETVNLLWLYEFIPLPIHFNFTANISVVLDISQADLIAIGHTQAFQTLSSSNLANCRHLGSTFFCDIRQFSRPTSFNSVWDPSSWPAQN